MESRSGLKQLLDNIRLRTKAGAWAAKVWQRYMLPLPMSKKFYGLKVYFNLRDGLFWLAVNPSEWEQNEHFGEMLAGIKGPIWDVGCNIGLFSLLAASKGFDVVAFDVSPVATQLVEKSARANGLKLRTICHAFATERYTYVPPRTAHPQNAPNQQGNRNLVDSITFSEAETKFGLPAFIKVDIEHNEVALLKSEAFKNWIKNNNICLLVELHSPEYSKLVWSDVRHCIFDNHVLFNPTPEHKTFCEKRG